MGNLEEAIERDCINKMKKNILELGQAKCVEITNQFSNEGFKQNCLRLIVLAAKELEEEGYSK